MRRIAALVLMVVGFGGFLVGIGLAPLEAQGGPHADTITIDGNIDPISAGYLARGIDKAHDDGAQLVFVILDTPGGRLDSTRDMVEKILGSEIPVVVYVSPPGSHAASAGTFIVAAAHVAAMAPATNIGAASPVGVSGEDLPETIKSKATQDAAAFIRDIAEERGRNADALEQTVLNAISYSSLEALDNNLVDIIAEDMDDLLAQLDGRRVEIGEGTYVLETDRLEMRRIEPTLVEQFLGFLADPNVAFLLLSLGGLGIWIEFLSPGLMGPGIVGVIALSLALVAMGNLPVNWAGVALIVVAMGLFFLESQAPGIGVFGITGAVSFVLGGFLLFGGIRPPPIPSPSFRVSLWVLGGVSGVLFAYLVFLLRSLVQARKARYPSGTQRLVGEVGVATTALDPRGSVQVASELWSAVSDSGKPIPEGEEVVVMDIDGLTLKVFKASQGNQ